ncbi:unnamed protein product [Symbiodinium sp. CCMP2592]|nr:unnamed protein product [Symbiodinium sp. CCMP2592]
MAAAIGFPGSCMRLHGVLLLLVLLVAHASNCSYDILMVDDRPFKRLSPFTAPYWVMSAALNVAFAREHEHGFHHVRPSNSKVPERMKNSFKGWNKVLYINQLLNLQDRSQCKWILYVDSDAFVRSSFSLERIVDRLLRKYQRPHDCRSSAIFAAEYPIDYAIKLENITGPGGSLISDDLQPTWINTGVFFVRADCPASMKLFRRWLAWAALLNDDRLWFEWPGEQGIMTELLQPNSYPPAVPEGSLEALGNLQDIRDSVVVVHMKEFNSPFGRDIQHAWGSSEEDARLRDWAMADALLRIGKADPRSFLELCREVLHRSFLWTRPALVSEE